MAKTKEELREARKQKLPTATTFSPRDSLSNLSSSNSDATRLCLSKFDIALAAPSFGSALTAPSVRCGALCKRHSGTLQATQRHAAKGSTELCKRRNGALLWRKQHLPLPTRRTSY
jgi:hypothetical protein